MSLINGVRIRLYTLILAVMLTVLPVTASADESGIAPPAQPDRISAEYVKGYFSDTGRMLSSPVNWDGNDWLKTGLVVAATAGIYLADTDIKKLAQRNQSSTGDSLVTIGNALGNPSFTLPPLGLLYLYGHFTDDSKARRTSLLAAESLAISGLFSVSVKLATQRPRPQTADSSTTWYGPRLNSGDMSFPSSHTTAAFSLASVIAEEYGTNPYVPPVAYGLASLTAFARIYDNKHWASDVFFGGAIGYFVGKTVVRYHTQSNSALTILPTAGLQGLGLTAQYRF
ncbi:MAG: phosphatase PAP2 family protein [Desulfuromonadaceae bacterium]